jgi:uncharacterized membrane protein
MDEKAVRFVIAMFDSETGAEETLSNLKTENKEALKAVQGAVAMRKDSESHIHYTDVGMTPSKGALAGVAIGAILGIATGGAGLVLGAAGALLGGVTGNRRRESQVAAEKINQVVASIPPGTSALLTIIDAGAAADFEKLLHASSQHTFSAEINANLGAALQEQGAAVHDALLEKLGT